MTMIPFVPAATIMFPTLAPSMSPAPRCVVMPAVKERRRMAVITHRHPQHEYRHFVWIDVIPGAVIPITDEPAAILEHPVHAVVEQIIVAKARRVIHRITGYVFQMRIHIEMDINIEASQRRGGHACHETERQQTVADDSHGVMISLSGRG